MLQTRYVLQKQETDFFDVLNTNLSFPFYLTNLDYHFFERDDLNENISFKFWKKENFQNFLVQVIKQTNNFANSFLFNWYEIELKKNSLDCFNPEAVIEYKATVPFRNLQFRYFDLKKISFSLNLNLIAHRVTGEFQWSFNLIENNSYQNGFKKLYYLSFIKSFFQDLLFPCTLDKLIDVNNSNSEQRIDQLLTNRNMDYVFLKKEFVRLSKQKVNYPEEDANSLFDEIWMMFLLQTTMVHLFQDVLANLNWKTLHEENFFADGFDLEQTLKDLNQNLRNYFNNDSLEENSKKLIKKQPVGLTALSYNYMMLCPNFIYYIDLNSSKKILHYEQIFNNPLVLSLFLFIFFPEIYSIDHKDYSLYSSYFEVSKINNLLLEVDLKYFQSLVKQTICEKTVLYYSFIHNNNVILFVNNYVDVLQTEDLKNLVNYYTTAGLLLSTHEQLLLNLQKAGDYIQFANKLRWKNIPYYKVIKDVESLTLNYTSGVLFKSTLMEKIMQKTDEDRVFSPHLKEQLENLQFNDELYKREIERSNFIIGFVVAILVGFVNFFGQVYSETTPTHQVLGTGYPGVDLHFPWIPMTISWTSTAELIMLIILFYAFYRMVYFRKHIKQIDRFQIRLL